MRVVAVACIEAVAVIGPGVVAVAAAATVAATTKQ